jgi:hypothetical protein
MSQTDQVFCQRLARLTHSKKLSMDRKASIRSLLRDQKSSFTPPRLAK